MKRHEIPHDLAERAKTMTLSALAEHYAIATSTMSDMLRRNGLKPVSPGLLRRDLEGIETLCRTMTTSQLSEHYGICYNSMRDHLRRRGLSAQPGSPGSMFWERHEIDGLLRVLKDGGTFAQAAAQIGRTPASCRHYYQKHLKPVHDLKLVESVQRPMPEDFATVARTMTTRDLQARYGCSKNLVARWRREIGSANPVPKKTVRPAIVAHFNQSAIPGRDMSVQGRAADHLRSPRGGGWLVNRCYSTGVSNTSGDHWRVGRLILTPDDLIRMAERKGFVAFADLAA